jgi:hypothetical protein
MSPARWENLTLHLGALLTGGTGIVYAVMRYLMEPADQWAVVNHPLQPLFQHLHLLSAPLLLFGLGLMWTLHLVAGWNSRKPRKSYTGSIIFILMILMVFSGYLIQVTTTQALLRVWVVLHVVSSVVWLLGYVAHLVSHYKSRLRRSDTF